MSENYDLISENDMHMPIRCIMQRFDHIRSQMHDYFELSMIIGHRTDKEKARMEWNG